MGGDTPPNQALDLEAGVEQTTQMWRMMLAQFTGMGATRQELAEFSLMTAQAILDTTKTELWPSTGANTVLVGEGEEEAVKGFHAVLTQMGAIRRMAFPKE